MKAAVDQSIEYNANSTWLERLKSLAMVGTNRRALSMYFVCLKCIIERMLIEGQSLDVDCKQPNNCAVSTL